MSNYVNVISSSDSSDEEPIVTKRSRRCNFSSSQESPAQPDANFYGETVDNFLNTKRKFKLDEFQEEKTLFIREDDTDEQFAGSSGKKRKSRKPAKSSNSSESPVQAEPTKEKANPLAIDDDDDDYANVPLPAKKTRRRTNSTQKILTHLSSAAQKFYQECDVPESEEMDSSFLDTSFENREIQIKVRCRTSIERLPLLRKSPFKLLLPKLGRIFQIPENQLILTLKNNEISPEETPFSLNFSVADIIDCIILSDKPAQDASLPQNPNIITIQFQCLGDRKKISLKMNKSEPLEKLMEELATAKGLELDTLIFKFDGENVDAVSTPEDLDMDDGDCIDVIIKKT